MENLDLIGVALFAVATVVALLVRRLLVPYTVGLVVAGLLLGATHVLKPPHLTKDLLSRCSFRGCSSRPPFTSIFLVCGGMSPSTRLAVGTFWEHLAFALNSIVFLLIGFEIDLPAMLGAWKLILASFGALTLGRAVVIAVVSAALGRSRERVPWRWSVVLTWGGLRGALSMVLALSLAPGFPHRDVLVSMTFGVVIISILVQGLTMAPLLRSLGVVRRVDDRRDYDLRRGEILATKAALGSLEEIARTHAVAPELVSILKSEYEGRLSATEAGLERVFDESAGLREEVLARIKRYLGTVERNALGEAARHGLIAEGAAQELTANIDGRLARSGQAAPEDEDS